LSASGFTTVADTVATWLLAACAGVAAEAAQPIINAVKPLRACWRTSSSPGRDCPDRADYVQNGLFCLNHDFARSRRAHEKGVAVAGDPFGPRSG
jgi:hypothetical protein